MCLQFCKVILKHSQVQTNEKLGMQLGRRALHYSWTWSNSFDVAVKWLQWRSSPGSEWDVSWLQALAMISLSTKIAARFFTRFLLMVWIFFSLWNYFHQADAFCFISLCLPLFLPLCTVFTFTNSPATHHQLCEVTGHILGQRLGFAWGKEQPAQVHAHDPPLPLIHKCICSSSRSRLQAQPELQGNSQNTEADFTCYWTHSHVR